MPLVNMRSLLAEAETQHRAVGAFNVSSIEMIVGVLQAAEELKTPVILQVAEARLATTPLPILGAAMLAAARQCRVRVAVHLDHGATLDCVRQALDIGFTSVMYDSSMLSMADNIARTRLVMDIARQTGAAVEAEIGSIGKTETGKDAPAICARPEDCLTFIEQTGVDALAVAIGNAHGIYVGEPHLRFDILEAVRQKSKTPLVLHGGTGISDEDFKHCIRLGMRKINIATATFMAVAKAAGSGGGYFELSAKMEAEVRAVALRHINIFGVAPAGDCEEGERKAI